MELVDLVERVEAQVQVVPQGPVALQETLVVQEPAVRLVQVAQVVILVLVELVVPQVVVVQQVHLELTVVLVVHVSIIHSQLLFLILQQILVQEKFS